MSAILQLQQAPKGTKYSRLSPEQYSIYLDNNVGNKDQSVLLNGKYFQIVEKTGNSIKVICMQYTKKTTILSAGLDSTSNLLRHLRKSGSLAVVSADILRFSVSPLVLEKMPKRLLAGVILAMGEFQPPKHPLTEVRIRSAQALQQKLEVGLCGINDLIQDATFMPKIISLLQSDSTVLKMHGINLLYFILQDTRGTLNFESLRGKHILQELRPSVPTHLEEKIESLLDKLNNKPLGLSVESDTEFLEESTNKRAEENISPNETLSSRVLPGHDFENSINTISGDNDDSCLSEKDLFRKIPFPILFITFPWVSLTNIDLKVLDSTGQSLVDVSEADLLAILRVCQFTLFKDYPIEIFLQRPFILKVLLGHLVAESEKGGNAWRLQEKIYVTLCTFTHHLVSRLMNFDLKYSPFEDSNGILNSSSGTSGRDSNDFFPQSKCCSVSSLQRSSKRIASQSINENASVETLHESDDSNEFMVLKVHQLTVIEWCCQLLNPTFELLKKSQPRLSSSLLRLISLTMQVLRSCVSPRALWHYMANSPDGSDQRALLRKVSSSLLQSLNILSKALVEAYNESKLPLAETDLKATWNKIKSITRVFIHWINLFSSEEEYDMVFGKDEVDAFQCLLSDPCFYLEYRKDHANVLFILRKMEEEAAIQVDALIEASSRLEDTKKFLQLSSSEVDEFQEKASFCIPLLFLHKSRVLIEKIVRGLAKQGGSPLLSPLQASKGRNILLQILSNPDQDSRVLGYNAVKNLVTENVGVSQASHTTKSRSLKVLLIMHSRIMNHLIFSGCADSTPQIVEASRTCLLALIRGHHLMTKEVLQIAANCFSESLINLQNLVDSETYLGRAVLNLPYELSKQRDGEEMHLLRVKFYLKCLFSKDSKVRQECLRNCLALLVTSSSEYISVPPTQLDIERDSNLFAINPSVEILPAYPTDKLDRHNLKNVLSLLSTQSLDKEMMEALWAQLTFLLRNPSLHSGLEAIWPISDTVRAFTTMMKISGGRSHTVSQVPFALEVLRLRASFSVQTRTSLASDSEFMLLILRAVLFFRTNDHVQLEASLLLSLILNEEVIVQTKSDSNLSFGTLSLPSRASSSQYVGFIHRQYSWPSEFAMTPRMRTLLSMETSEENSSLPVRPVDFIKLVWAGICTTDYKDLLGDFDFASSFSGRLVLRGEEATVLRTSLSIPYAARLLMDVENATSHRAVKRSVNLIQALIAIVEDDDESKVAEILKLDGWNKALARFFLCSPATALDKQLVFHVMNVIGDSLSNVVRMSSKEKECVYCPLIYLLSTEFSKPDGSLSTLLKETGTVEFSSSNHTPQTLQSLQLLNSLLTVVSLLFRLSTHWECKCQPSPPQWQNLAKNIAQILTIITRKCKTLPDYNLTILVPTLECFIDVVKYERIGETSLRLTPLLIDLLMSFHVGRGRAHNTFLGRAVTLRALLILAFVIANAESEAVEVINAVCDEVPSLPWLLSALEHTDPSLMAAGMKVAISLSMTPFGARVLDESFDHIPGGIWTMALRYLVRCDLGAPARISSAYILLNLSSHVVRLPQEERPWLSLSLTDTLTGGTAVREDALVEILKLFRFFGLVRQLLRGIKPFSEEEGRAQNVVLELEELNDFVSSEESEWATSDRFEEDDVSMETYVGEFPEFLEASLQLVINLLQINHRRMMEMISSNGVGKVLVKQFGLLTEDVKVSDKWNRSLDCGFRLLKIMGKPFSHNTHLSSLALNVFLADYAQSPSLKRESLNLLSCMVVEGGWGAVRVMEILRTNPSPVCSAVVEFLHEGSTCKASGVSFVGSLCKAATVSPQTYMSSLQYLLDTPLQMHSGEKTVCPGWEISRHLIQLLPSKLDSTLSNCYSVQVDEDEGNVKLFLEALKLLLLVSKSARECAYFQDALLLKLFSFALSNLNVSILSINIHITSNIMNKKELRNDLILATHCLQVATNWITEVHTDEQEAIDSVPCNPLVIGECLIPLLHPLWVPALRAPPFAEAVIQFLITSSSRAEVCPILTRTSVLPGSLLSGSRTRKSLLVSILMNVSLLLDRKKGEGGGRCTNGCGTLPKALLEDALDLLVNCGRVHETAYVIVKEGFLKTVVNFLERFKDLNSPLPQKIIQCLTILTLHKEVRAALIKIPCWIKCLKTCLQEKLLRKNILLVFANMVTNVQVVKNMLSSEDFLVPVAKILTEVSNELTKGIGYQPDAEVHICVVVLWCLAANNHRCKATLKRLNIRPYLENLVEHHRHPQLCLQLMNIINS